MNDGRKRKKICAESDVYSVIMMMRMVRRSLHSLASPVRRPMPHFIIIPTSSLHTPSRYPAGVGIDFLNVGIRNTHECLAEILKAVCNMAWV